MDDEERLRRVLRSCTAAVRGHGLQPAGDVAAELAALGGSLTADVYGDGGVVAELEREVASLLGMPAAVFMPSGTMAQQIALRLHAQDTGRGTVLCHPTCHLLLHEDEAAMHLHDLVLHALGDAEDPLTPAALAAVQEPPAALLLELPQREIGGPLPSWAELQHMVGWARDHGARVHLDGARLWESQPFYDRPHRDIAALFDTVYVSLYKTLGGIAGACLAGPTAQMDRARVWRHRHGGTMFRLWPYAASGLIGLRLRLGRIDGYVAHARAIAAEIREDAHLQVRVDPPPTSLLHVAVRTSAAALRARAWQLAVQEGMATWTGSRSSAVPGWQVVELSVGDATMALSAGEVAEVLRRLAEPLPREPSAQLVEVIDDDGAVVDVVSRGQMRAMGARHRCTYVALVTSDDELIVHRRADWKDVHPGAWDVVFGGICDVGEGWAESAARELAEEAGIAGVPLEPLATVSWSGDGAALQGRVYLARSDADPSCPDGEVAEIARVPLRDLAAWADGREICHDSRDVVLPLLLDLAIS